MNVRASVEVPDILYEYTIGIINMFTGAIMAHGMYMHGIFCLNHIVILFRVHRCALTTFENRRPPSCRRPLHPRQWLR